MENSELIKQFQATVYETEILITTATNREKAYEAQINFPDGKQMWLIDKYKNHYDWIETSDKALNYYECCGILILFRIEPISFQELYKLLS